MLGDKMANIRVSPKHGVNPTIPICFFCAKQKNEIILVGRLKGDIEAPQHLVWNNVPCDECKEWMKRGIILISIQDADVGKENPYRTGGWVVVTEEALARIVATKSLLETILRERVVFIPDQVWDQIVLPRSGDYQETGVE
jgi:hypothetical protein